MSKLTVDDILNEIKTEKAKEDLYKKAAENNMDRIDDIVRDILTKKQEIKLSQEKREITRKEKEELEQEIKEQTKTLTKQFACLKKEIDEQQKIQNQESNENKANAIEEDNVLLSNEDFELDEKKPTRSTNSTQEKEDKESDFIKNLNVDIASHFGNFKIDEDNFNKDDKKTQISTSNFKELKNKRSKKIEEFVLEPVKKPDESNPQPRQSIEKELKYSQPVEDKKLKEDIAHIVSIDEDEEDIEEKEEFQYTYEYTKEENALNVSAKLKQQLRSSGISVVVLFVTSILGVLLSFTAFNEETGILLGKFSITPAFYAIANMIILMIGFFVSGDIIKNAINGISKGEPSKDLIYAITFMIIFITNIVFCIFPDKLLSANVQLYTPVMLIVMLFSFISKNIAVKRILSNFKHVSSTNTNEKYAVTYVQDEIIAQNMTKGLIDNEPYLIKTIQTDFYENFIANSFKYEKSDRVVQKTGLIILPLAIVLAGISFMLTKDIFASLSVLSAAMLVVTGILGAVFVVLPLGDTSDLMNQFSGIISGYDAVEQFKDSNCVMVEATDLFPIDAIGLAGIKTFKGNRIDEALLDAASVICSSKSILKGVFLSIIGNEDELLKKVDSITYEDLMGVSAWVDDRRVLIGNRELMINHSIPVPKKDYEQKYEGKGKRIIYLSTSGELCAAFIVDFSSNKAVLDSMNMLAKNDMKVVIKSVDSCITPDLLSEIFDLDMEMFKILPSRLHKDFDNEMKPKESTNCLLGHNGSLFGYIVSVVAVKKIHSCIGFGSFLYILSVIVGIVLLSVQLIFKMSFAFANIYMMLYMVIFALIYFVYEKNLRI